MQFEISINFIDEINKEEWLNIALS